MVARKHGDNRTVLYDLWAQVKQRCCNPKYRFYSRYGGRGITMHDQWRADYASFKEWALANGYKKGLQIDRIDNDGNYEPINCRFVTPKVNNNNKKNNRKIVAFGETRALSEWADDPRCVVNYFTLRMRVIAGWGSEEAITLNRQKNGKSRKAGL